MRLDVQPADELDELVEDLADLRHDVGKYIGFETRFAGPEPDTATLRAALRTDLLSTRRRGERVEAAWEVWARLRPDELEGDPDVERIDAAMAELRTIDLEGDRAVLDRAAALAAEVTGATRSLHERARALVQG